MALDKTAVEAIVKDNEAIIGTDSDRIHLKSQITRFATEMAAAFAIAEQVMKGGPTHHGRPSLDDVLKVYDRLRPTAPPKG